MTDDELIGYAAIHCETDLALFSAQHLRRLSELAGHEAPRLILDGGYYPAHEGLIRPLLEAIRAKQRSERRGQVTMAYGIKRGFYRHYKEGHVYYVHGVGCNPHDAYRRSVIYTSVKTEEVGTPGQPRYDFLIRDEAEFAQWVTPPDQIPAAIDAGHPSAEPGHGFVPRFERIKDPAASTLPGRDGSK